MSWPAEFTEKFEPWWDSLSVAGLLEKHGPALPRPFSDVLHGSRYARIKELRIQHGGQPYRVLYAFDPRRMALLLLGGNKTGDNRWYDKFLPQAERLFEEHLRQLEREERKEE